MAFDQLPIQYDINIYQGNDVLIPCVLKQDYALVDITDYVITAEILQDVTNIAFDVAILDQTTKKGQFTIGLSNTVTENLSGYYDWVMSYLIEITPAQGEVPAVNEIRTIAKGRLHVEF